jgi:hypothetical protein
MPSSQCDAGYQQPTAAAGARQRERPLHSNAELLCGVRRWLRRVCFRRGIGSRTGGTTIPYRDNCGRIQTRRHWPMIACGFFITPTRDRARPGCFRREREVIRVFLLSRTADRKSPRNSSCVAPRILILRRGDNLLEDEFDFRGHYARREAMMQIGRKVFCRLCGPSLARRFPYAALPMAAKRSLYTYRRIRSGRHGSRHVAARPHLSPQRDREFLSGRICWT